MFSFIARISVVSLSNACAKKKVEFCLALLGALEGKYGDPTKWFCFIDPQAIKREPFSFDDLYKTTIVVFQLLYISF